MRCSASRTKVTGVVIVILRDRTRSPRELADAVQRSGSAEPSARAHAAPPRCCAPTASARRSCKDLGVRRMQVLSAPKHLHGISAFGLEITGYVGEQACARSVYSSSWAKLQHPSAARPAAWSPSWPRASTPSWSSSSSTARAQAWRGTGGERRQLRVERVPGAFELPLRPRMFARQRPRATRSWRWAA